MIDEGIDEENEPKTLKDELFEEVNKRGMAQNSY